MAKRIDKSARSPRERGELGHRFEHWYVDNQVYFITARCRDKYPAFADERAKAVFWDRFDHYTKEAGFVPWVTSLLDNHYHTLGYIRVGMNLKHMMQRLHGSVAKQVNDLLPERRSEFFRDVKGREYFDGCIRDQKQCRRAFEYTRTQAVRHGIVPDWRAYPHTHVKVELERGVKRALELGAFLRGVPYPRYGR